MTNKTPLNRVAAGLLVAGFSAMTMTTMLRAETFTAPHADFNRAITADQGPAPPALDFRRAPETLREMWSRSQLVIRGRVEAMGAPELRPNEDLVKRFHTVRVIEILKSRGTVPPTIRLLQYGGTVLRNGREFSTAYADDLLQANDEAILFLQPAPEPGVYMFAFGRTLLPIDVAKATARIPPALDHVDAFKGRRSIPLEELRPALRALARPRI